MDELEFSEQAEALAQVRGITTESEHVVDALERVAVQIGDVDRRLGGQLGFGERVLVSLRSGATMPGTPILTNVGRDRPSAAACTVMNVPLTDGSIDLVSLMDASSAVLSEGVGTGFDLSHVDDPVAELVRLNEALWELNARLVASMRRPVAAMVTLDAGHPRVGEFIHAKDDADFSNWLANISLTFNTDADRLFEDLVGDIAIAAHRTGEPGVLFFDRFDADNATPSFEYKSTAPCAEVAMAAGELCHFWYVNLERHVNSSDVDWSTLRESVHLAVRALDAAVEISVTGGASSIVEMKRRVGVGVMGFHSMLIELGLPYASSAAERLAAELSEFVTFSAHSESARLAVERGPFPLFPASRLLDPDWVSRKHRYRTGIVRDAAWQELGAAIGESGLRHASVVAYPPTGTSSELIGSSKAYEPLFALSGRSQPQAGTAPGRELLPVVARALQRSPVDLTAREAVHRMKTRDGMLGVDQNHLLATAREISPDRHLAVHRAFQRFSDESGSKTINVEQAVPALEIERLLIDARRSGLKGLTVFRDGCLDERISYAVLKEES